MTPSPEKRDLRLLLLEDDPSDAKLCRIQLERAGYRLRADMVATRAEFALALENDSYDLIIADYQLPSWSGQDALDLLRQRDDATPLIMVTGTLSDEAVSECMRNGASDYILKDRLARLPFA